jgi:co-chaperonin GroES (HSP10)
MEIERASRMPDGSVPSDALLAGRLRIHLHPGYVVLRRAKTPTHVASGLLEIPEKFRDEPMEGIVVAVGPGRLYEERYCCGLGGRPDGVPLRASDEGTYADCGMRATARLVPMDEILENVAAHLFRPRIYVCEQHGQQHMSEGGTLWWRVPASSEHIAAEFEGVLASICPLLTHRPPEVKVGDRVIFSRWAGAKQKVNVLGEDLIITDDVCAIVEGDVGLIIRHEAV